MISKFMSQIGQDMWVIEEVFNYKENGYFVDLAATGGILINNTYLLETELNWTGICIEPNPILFKHLKKNRNCIINKNVIDDKSNKIVNFRIDTEDVGGIVDVDTDNKPEEIDENVAIILQLKTKTLEEILDENCAPKIIDYFSLDVEGCETRILKDFTFNKYTFLALTIERPTPELNEILRKNGYIFAMNCFFDTFYVHKSIPNFDNIKKEPFQQIDPMQWTVPTWFYDKIIEKYGPDFSPYFRKRRLIK